MITFYSAHVCMYIRVLYNGIRIYIRNSHAKHINLANCRIEVRKCQVNTHCVVTDTRDPTMNNTHTVLGYLLYQLHIKCHSKYVKAPCYIDYALYTYRLCNYSMEQPALTTSSGSRLSLSSLATVRSPETGSALVLSMYMGLWPANTSQGVTERSTLRRWSSRKVYWGEAGSKACSVLIRTKWMQP